MTQKYFSIAFCLCLFIFINSYSVLGQTEIEKVTSTVTEDRAKGHLTFIASDELQGRNVGTPGIETAAMYIKTQLMSYGVGTAPSMDGYYQNVPLVSINPPSHGSLALSESKFSFPNDFIIHGGQSTEGVLSFVFLDFNDFSKLSSSDVKGKLVITTCGDGSTQSVQAWFYQSKEKIKQLKEAGAIGLVEMYQSNKVPFKFLRKQFTKTQVSLGESETEDFLHIWLDAGDEAAVTPLKKPGNLKVDVNIPSYESLASKNVVGFVEGTDPKLKNEYIVYSAHYDHVGIGKPDANQDSIYNGARDNGVGVTAILELASNIAKYPTKRSALFVLFTAEEKGLLGSKHFVDHAPVPLDDIVYNFNIDNGGYNDTTIISVVGLERTTAEDHIQSACSTFGLEGIEDPAKEQGLFDRSDNVNFAKKGIPAPTFSLGFRAFDEEIFKYYHQPADEVSTLDFNYLLKYFKSYVLSARYIANAPDAPFWIEGDKYYEAGKNLYGK